MTENVLVIGSGGREHALCWKLAESEKVQNIYVSPGNVGISSINKVTAVELPVKDFQAVAEWCKNYEIQLVVIGPEDPLAGGIADVLYTHGILCFGPSKAAARIESCKDWAKSFMDRHNIPTARWKSFKKADDARKFIIGSSYRALVVKASGLAAGKGVIVAASKEEACGAVDKILSEQCFGSAGETIVLEELLEGEEVSVLAFTDGKTVRAMLPAQDHKRLMDNDAGANTGGMGAYCPCPLLSSTELDEIMQRVLQQAVDGLAAENTPFIGVLYAGLMLTKDGPKVLEFNCRFGDPETQVILPLLESDLYQVMLACCQSKLHDHHLEWKKNLFAVGVVMASAGYPSSSSKGDVIVGLEQTSCLIFHSGTALDEKNFVTNGGRVLIVVSLAPELALAAARATRECGRIVFRGAQYRRDIAHKGIARSILKQGQLTYKESGVDIVAGETFVNQIKVHVGLTSRSGIMGGIGGFGGLFDTKAAGYKDPVLVSGTDGVGTKLKVALACGQHSTVGIDLVAMCVNDILAHGAEPLFFLDYFACGVLQENVATQVIAGIAEGCKEAGCSIIGGETAEMPGLYQPGDYDLAGFTVGAVERSSLLPLIDCIVPGDKVIALPSSGIHSNGFSLVRKVLEKNGLSFSDLAPFSNTNKTIGEELLTPTKIYVKSVLPLLQIRLVKAIAHITGGGLTDNIPRILPSGLGVQLDATKWEVQPVFGWLAATGDISESELLHTFNCGVGMVLITSGIDCDLILQRLPKECANVIGVVSKLESGDENRVQVNNFVSVMEGAMQPYIKSVVKSLAPNIKRVGVLISGSGTNLQALIDATTDLGYGAGAEIVLVISNKPGVQGLKRAERANIPTKVIPHGAFTSRLEFDMAIFSALKASGVEIVCLAGFMRVLTGDFVRLWHGRLINIHPSLLPLFKGTNAHRQALQAGVRVTGCTAHFVEEDIDAGAILAQEAVPIELYDTEETLQERVKIAEHKVFPKALKLVATGQVYLGDDGKLIWKN